MIYLFTLFCNWFGFTPTYVWDQKTQHRVFWVVKKTRIGMRLSDGVLKSHLIMKKYKCSEE